MMTVLVGAASAQELTEQQVEALVRRGEQQLSNGQAKQALLSTQKLTAILLAEGALNYPDYAKLWDRATVLSATALVRLEGRDPTRPDAEPRKNLEEAEQRFAELLPPVPAANSGAACKTCPAAAVVDLDKLARWRSRHGEALVALGRYQDAYKVLSSVYIAKKLEEAEGAAALARAAAETSQAEIAAAADARCRELAKKRARSVCGAQVKPPARDRR